MTDTKPTSHPKLRYSRQRIPVEVAARIPQPKYLKNPCGFCSTDHHESCPRGFRSGNGSVMLCPCESTQHPSRPHESPRCLECRNDDIDELDEKLWLCIEIADCEARVNNRLDKNPSMQMIHEAYLNADVRKAADKIARPARNRNPGRPSTGKCLCCGEPTAGGLFLPGHDARLVSQTAKKVEAGADPIVTLGEFKELGVSDALYAKLQRKLERL